MKQKRYYYYFFIIIIIIFFIIIIIIITRPTTTTTVLVAAAAIVNLLLLLLLWSVYRVIADVSTVHKTDAAGASEGGPDGVRRRLRRSSWRTSRQQTVPAATVAAATHGLSQR